MKFFDIGANLTDPVFQGVYRGSQKHRSDFDDIMNRGKEVGLVGHMITGGTLSDSQDALNISNERNDCYSTCGVHPTRCNEFESADDPEEYLNNLKKLIIDNPEKILAVGECGIDYTVFISVPKISN